MRVIYNIDGNLADVLVVAMELASETGMKPELITLNDGSKVKFQHEDFRELLTGKINEDEYIRRNLIGSKIESDVYKLIKQWYRNPKENEEYLFQMPIEIMQELKAAHKIDDSMGEINEITIGQSLRALGYERIGKNTPGLGTRYGYKVIKLY